MLALKITDVKGFMNQLLIGDTFDSFPMAEASITTFNTFSIDGMLNKDFFDTDMQDILTQKGQVYSLWKDLKPFCFSVIRGKRTPLHFKIIFQLTPSQLPRLTGEEESAAFTNISSLFLNIQYKNNFLLCTTGTFQKSFSMDKSAEQLWDQIIQKFFLSQNIVSETV
ncbi:DUF5721 family protein [Blautia sp.]|uniref:Uncharacterized protein n=1 Tax=Blautia glucerasea TaxID=536633 RepID=A0A6N2TSE2_9FIRM|nr:DUF5721 family protein [uncultured Blautia sp.]